MLKRWVNDARFTLTLTTTGPVLVRSGHATLSGPNMTPVLTHRDGELQVYLPGSSLKGVIRSHLEKVGRTLADGVVCNPFDGTGDRAPFCGAVLQKRKDNQEDITSEVAYHDSCPICRLFGSTQFIGRVSLNDAYLTEWPGHNPTETRDGVGIDRLTGGASGGAKFDMEVVSAGVEFATDVYVRNFEIWQLGLLMLVVNDFQDGLVRVGSGTSRGLGAVKGAVDEVILGYPYPLVTDKPAEAVWGMGKFHTQEEREAYGTCPDDALTLDVAPEEARRGIRLQAAYRGAALEALSREALDAAVARIQHWAPVGPAEAR
jgi:CRISPR-associated RAMP protein (TIGR02581 family)